MKTKMLAVLVTMVLPMFATGKEGPDLSRAFRLGHFATAFEGCCNKLFTYILHKKAGFSQGAVEYWLFRSVLST